MAKLLRRIEAPEECLDLIRIVLDTCEACRKFRRPPTRPVAAAELAGWFNEVVQMDLFFLWDLIFSLLIDEATRMKIAEELKNKLGATIMRAIMMCWMRYFGPMRVLVSDQEGAPCGKILDPARLHTKVIAVEQGAAEKTASGGFFLESPRIKAEVVRGQR